MFFKRKASRKNAFMIGRITTITKDNIFRKKREDCSECKHVNVNLTDYPCDGCQSFNRHKKEGEI